MNDPKLTDCPEEGCAGKIKRMLGTGAAVIFKGSGFYQTDYRSESYKKGESKDTGSKTQTDSTKSSGEKGKAKVGNQGKSSDTSSSD